MEACQVACAPLFPGLPCRRANTIQIPTAHGTTSGGGPEGTHRPRVRPGPMSSSPQASMTRTLSWAARGSAPPSAELLLALPGAPSFPGRLAQWPRSVGAHLPSPPFDFLVKCSSQQADHTTRAPSSVLHGALRRLGPEHVLLIQTSSHWRGVPSDMAPQATRQGRRCRPPSTRRCLPSENSPSITLKRSVLTLNWKTNRGVPGNARLTVHEEARSAASLLTRSANVY